MTTPLAVVAGFALSVLGLFAGFTMTAPVAPELAPATGSLEQPAADPLAELGLDAEQAERIEALHSREAQRVEALQRALADAEDSLRRAELEVPFDAERVNELVARQAELVALLRGTESRVVAEIVALLHPEQQRRFAELRAGAAPGSAREGGAPAPAEPPLEDAADARGVEI
jgi:Spy/CpxP family protein refolding chaperone